MKKTILNLIPMLLSVLLIWSCKKEMPVVHQKLDLNQSLVAMQKPETQRIAFETMTSSERLSLWQNHVTWAKTNLTLTAVQREKLNELDAFLTAAFFETENNSDAFVIWQATASEVFSPKQIYLLFHQPFAFSKDFFTNSDPLSGIVDGGSGSSGGGGKPACGCSREDSYCNLILHGTFGNGAYTCDVKDCTIAQKGCGWLWRKECNGLCEYHLFPGIGSTSSNTNNR
jgi:hypothetical protein